jgi:hypothetical protein
MSRFVAFLGWFFTCLGITLLGVSILVVPGEAFADPGSDCYGACKNASDSGACVAGCCQQLCGSNSNDRYNNCVAEANSLLCPNAGGCDNGCAGNNCIKMKCDPTKIECKCDADEYNANCSKYCACTKIVNGCECGNK